MAGKELFIVADRFDVAKNVDVAQVRFECEIATDFQRTRIESKRDIVRCSAQPRVDFAQALYNRPNILAITCVTDVHIYGETRTSKEEFRLAADDQESDAFGSEK